jgi:uncharacterized protein YndB with AHSA1/START domain
MTTTVEKTVTVNAPVSVVYNTWTQFEDFPLFMGGVKEVRQLSDTRLHWVAEIAGVQREWEATVLEQVPDQKVAWAATEGATNAGSVRFASTGPSTTVVTLNLEYEPEGLVEKAGDFLNIVERRAEADLQNFSELIDKGGREPGGWRGSVNPGADLEPGVDAAAMSQGDSGKSGVSGKAVAAGLAAGAAVAAAGAAAARSGGQSEQTTPVDTGDRDAVETDVVVTDTVTPADDATTTGLPSETYPVADDPAPFSEAAGDDLNDGRGTSL